MTSSMHRIFLHPFLKPCFHDGGGGIAPSKAGYNGMQRRSAQSVEKQLPGHLRTAVNQVDAKLARYFGKGDYYAKLGVARNAEKQEIMNAIQLRLKELKRIHAVLVNTENRNRYDRKIGKNPLSLQQACEITLRIKVRKSS